MEDIVNLLKAKGTYLSSKVLCHKKLLLFLILLVFVTFSFTRPDTTKADANSMVGVKVNYLEETVTLSPGSGGSAKYYMSLNDKKTWEVIDPTNTVDKTATIDISGYLSTKAIDVIFKGNKDLNPTTLTLQAEDRNLKASYVVINGVSSITVNQASLQYKKGANGDWKTYNGTLPLASYEIKGTTLYFRSAPLEGKRAGKVITVKVPKRPTAPSIKLDASKLLITGLKVNEIQYRVNDTEGWTTFTSTDPKVKTKTLLSFLSTTTPPPNTVIPAGRIEFRTIGKDKKIASAVKVIEVTLQPTLPADITLTGSTITILDSDTKRNYEYTKIAQGATLNIETAKWTTITSKAPVIIKNATVGEKVYVRLKSFTDSSSKQLVLPSTYKELTITSLTSGK
ncbi:MAG: hypothetical protein QM644_04520 [Mobilitalea sp.]